MDPDAANKDVTVKQHTNAANPTGINRTLTAAMGCSWMRKAGRVKKKEKGAERISFIRS